MVGYRRSMSVGEYSISEAARALMKYVACAFIIIFDAFRIAVPAFECKRLGTIIGYTLLHHDRLHSHAVILGVHPSQHARVTAQNIVATSTGQVVRKKCTRVTL